MLTHLRPVLALSALGLVLLPAGASARSFERTFPRAAALCAAVDAGKPPASLAGATAQVKTACTALKSGHASAEAAFAASTAGLQAQMDAIVANARAACADARAAHDRAACAAATRDARTALRPILERWRTAARAQQRALNTARRAFWATVTALRGTTSPPPVPDPVPPVDPDPIGIT